MTRIAWTGAPGAGDGLAPSWLSRRMVAWVVGLLLAWGWGLMAAGGASAQTFLSPDKAFQLQVQPAGPGQLTARFAVARAYYLYRERLQAQWAPTNGGAAADLKWTLPAGEQKHDPTFDKVLEVYHGDVDGVLSLPPAPPGLATLTVTYQGCADAGICYPPQKRRYEVTWGPQGQVLTVLPLGEPARPRTALLGGAGARGGAPVDSSGGGAATSSEADRVTRALASGQWWVIVSVFALAGLLLAFTPCVLPMVPILSSIIVGQGGGAGRARGFALALSYSQGMALVYTALGVAAGLLGQGLAAYLQHPWVVLGFGTLMAVLALSMFGLYELQLPAAVQSWLGAGTNRLPGGRFASVFVMGVVSALIVSPCVSAPLAGALVYISQSRDVVLGGSALYAMAWGMSVPLLLVGLSAGSLLPHAGPWMKAVKVFFGLLLLVMAAWIARPAWPYVVAQVMGPQAVTSTHRSVLPFERVRSVAELDARLAQATAQGRSVMLDFYADWCTACLEMEHGTFTDARVRTRLAQAVLLQADVTTNTDDDRALLARFQLFGPPGIVFYDAQGREQPTRRVVGFQKPDDFVASLGQAGL